MTFCLTAQVYLVGLRLWCARTTRGGNRLAFRARMRLALMHVTGSRPAHPAFQAELDALTDATIATVAALGWEWELESIAPNQAVNNS